MVARHSLQAEDGAIRTVATMSVAMRRALHCQLPLIDLIDHKCCITSCRTGTRHSATESTFHQVFYSRDEDGDGRQYCFVLAVCRHASRCTERRTEDLFLD